jgi:putative ABC transport system permease protein
MKFANLLRRNRAEEELAREISAHLGVLRDTFQRQGMAPEEARLAAKRAFGGIEQAKELHRDERAFRLVADLQCDIRYALRTMRRNPGFTTVAALTLALGIGGNAAVFAVAYGILMRPLPYREPSQLVVMNLLFPDGGDLGFHPPSVANWLERLKIAGDAAAYNVRDVTVRGNGESAVVSTTFVTDQFFRVLGVPAIAGETADFGRRGGLVVTRRLVDRLLHVPASQAIGRSITVGENNHLIAAVIAPVFAFPAEGNDAWVVATLSATTKPEDTGNFKILLRLKPDTSIAQLIEHVKDQKNLSISSIGEAGRREMAPVLRVSAGAGLLLLSVACANVATLFIGRNVTRRRELAARLALGAGSLQVARAMFVETLLLATIASAVGSALAAGLLQLFVRHATGVLPRVLAIGLDGPVLLWIVVLTVTAAVVCGAFPTWQATRPNVHMFLRSTTNSTPVAWKIRGALVVAQIAFAIVLLTGAGLLTRSVMELMNENHGFMPGGALEAKIVLADRPLLTANARSAFIRELLARVRALPGVEFAGLGNALPPSPRLITVATRFTDKGEGINEDRLIKVGSVTPDFLRALGAQFLSGRDFSEAEGAGVVLTESAARFLFRGKEPIGGYVTALPRIIQFVGKPSVIGVVRDIKYEGLDSPPGITVYVPWDSRPMGTAYLVVRSSANLTQLSTTIRRLIREIDPAIPVPEIQPLETAMASSIADRRLQIMPAVGFGALALTVALMGVFAALSRAVSERKQELAIRSSVGASSHQLVWMILAKGLLLIGFGVVVGLGLARLFGQSLSHLLYHVSPYDPLTFGGVALLVSAASFLIVYLAAWRAARVDLLLALRFE